MPESVLRLRIRSNEVKEAERDLDAMGDEANEAARKVDRLGDRSQRAGRQVAGLSQSAARAAARMGAVAGAATAAASAFVAFNSIRISSSFEQQMSAVLAVTGATAIEFKALGELARELGSTTTFSARQAAEGMEFLARAGFNANEILAATPGVLQLAQAGALDLGRAADIASNVLSQFALQATEISRVNDVLAKSAASANVTVNSLGEALKFAGPQAQALGISLEEAVAAISVLGDSGLQGGLAGRGFVAFTSALIREQNKLEEVIGEFDLQADGLNEVLRRLAEANIPVASAIDFFGAENLDIFNTLTLAANRTEKSIQDLTQELLDAAGFSEKTAKTLTDNFDGASKAVASAAEAFQISFGLATIRDGTDDLIEFAEVLGDQETLRAAEALGEALADAFQAFIQLVNDATVQFRNFVNFLTSQGVLDATDLRFTVDDDEVDLAQRSVEELIGLDGTRVGLRIAAQLDEAGVEAIQRLIQRLLVDRELNIQAINESRNPKPRLFEEVRQIESAVASLRGVISIAERISPALNAANDNIETEADGVAETLSDLSTAIEDSTDDFEDAFRDAIRDLQRSNTDRLGAAFSLRAESDEARIERLLRERDLSGLEAFVDRLGDRLVADVFGLGELVRQGQITPEQNVELLSIIAEENRRAADGAVDAIGEIRGLEISLLEAIDRATLSIEVGFDAATDILGIIRDETRSLFEKLPELLRSGGRAAEQIGGAIGGTIGAVLGSVGQIASAVGSALGFFQSLFGNPSNNAAGVGVDLSNLVVESTFAKNNDQENIEFRDSLIDATFELARALQDLTGADLVGGLSITAGDRFTRVIGGGAGTDVQVEAGDSEAAIEAIFDALVGALRGGEQAFVDYVQAAQEAGRAPQDVIEGLERLNAIYDLNTEALSNVEQQFRAIDEAIDPVVDDLIALGQSIEEIENVRQEARRQVGLSEFENVQQQILDIQNSTLGEYNRILREIEQRQRDAELLLSTGAITPGEFEAFEFLSALQAQQFFEGLSTEELEALGDFFGVLEDRAGGSVVALARLTEGIKDFTSNVVETIEELRREAERIQASVDRALETRSDILREFSPFLPREQLGDLRGQLNNILASIQDPNASGDFIADQIDLASELARQFTDLSAEVFGPTAQFAQNRDFATQILQDIADVGQDEADTRLSIVDAANEQVEILREIEEQISGPDPSLEFLRDQLETGRVTNDILRELLEQYIEVASIERQQLNPDAIRAATEAFFANGGSAAPLVFDQTDVINTLVTSRQQEQANANSTLQRLQRLIDLGEDNVRISQEALDLAKAA